jgi:hypothetical protein
MIIRVPGVSIDRFNERDRRIYLDIGLMFMDAIMTPGTLMLIFVCPWGVRAWDHD